MSRSPGWFSCRADRGSKARGRSRSSGDMSDLSRTVDRALGEDASGNSWLSELLEGLGNVDI